MRLCQTGEFGVGGLPCWGDPQGFVPPIIRHLLTGPKPPPLQRRNGTADLGFVQIGTDHDLARCHLAIMPKVKKRPPFRPQHLTAFVAKEAPLQGDYIDCWESLEKKFDGPPV